jgi:hypothetical protein
MYTTCAAAWLLTPQPAGFACGSVEVMVFSFDFAAKPQNQTK